MVKKKDPICLDFVVKKHETQEEAEKPTKYVVKLKSKVALAGQIEVTAIMTVKSNNADLIALMPLTSERRVRLVDEQTTLETETTE